MWAFARENVKGEGQQDSHLAEESKASSGIETRRNNKPCGCEEVKRGEVEASRKLVKKENGFKNKRGLEAKKERKERRKVM